MSRLPTGTVTLLFTDIEGSTRLLESVGDVYEDTLADHHRLIRAALSDYKGVEVDTAGDGFFAVFESPTDALGGDRHGPAVPSHPCMAQGLRGARPHGSAHR